jgi:hypothetical protein
MNLQVLAWLFIGIAVSLNPPCDSEMNAHIYRSFLKDATINNKKYKTQGSIPELRSMPCVTAGPVTFGTQAIPPNGAHMTQV